MVLTQIVRELEAQQKVLQAHVNSLDRAITTLRGLIGGRQARARHVMSAAARKRIAAAQKARWAKWRAQRRKKK